MINKTPAKPGRSSRAVLFFGLVLAGVLAACGPEVLPEADPVYVSARSPSLIGINEALRVVLVTPEEGVGAGDAADPAWLSLNPARPGRLSWADPSTLQFTPDQPWEPGQTYTVAVSPRVGPRFGWQFQARPLNFQVESRGLRELEAGRYQAEFVISAEAGLAPAALESRFRAAWSGPAPALSWTHEGVQRTLRVGPLERQSADQSVSLAWTNPAGQTEQLSLTVPAADRFALLEAVRRQDGADYIEVILSDTPDPSQDLRGLVQLEGRDDVRLGGSGNRLRLYTQSPLRDTETVRLDPNLQSARRLHLGQAVEAVVARATEVPGLRWSTRGVIFPSASRSQLPIETRNLRAVQVEAVHIRGNNILQHLQVNDLAGGEELYRVGTVVWRDLVPLAWKDEHANQWVRHALDLRPLLAKFPEGMFQIRVSFKPPQVVWNQPLPAAPPGARPLDWKSIAVFNDDLRLPGDQDYFSLRPRPEGNDDWDNYYQQRNNPLHPAFYNGWYSNAATTRLSRNVLLSDLGLSAHQEADSGLWVLHVSRLADAQAVAGATVRLFDFQKQTLAQGVSDAQGRVRFEGQGSARFATVELGGQTSYLDLSSRNQLSYSSFPVDGQALSQNVNGFLYAERGVWRPGDRVHLFFLLRDPDKVLPADHPVSLEVRNSRGQIAYHRSLTRGLGGFYAFPFDTRPEDPTGDWNAVVRVGDREFSKSLKIETIMPNRLKVEFLNAPAAGFTAGRSALEFKALWLTGPPGANLNAVVDLYTSPVPTTFAAWPGFSFDDAVRAYEGRSAEVLRAALDGEGRASVPLELDGEQIAPGRLNARFTFRIFEPSGVFSTEQHSWVLNPYTRYAGLKINAQRNYWGSIVSGRDHDVELALVSPEGQAEASGELNVELYRIDWAWWWEVESRNLASYIDQQRYRPLQSARVPIRQGRGRWTLRIPGDDWGLYLLRVKDAAGGHIASERFYSTPERWSGPANLQNAESAQFLGLTADKASYAPGENAVITLPTGAGGRALVTVEVAGRIRSQEWVAPQAGGLTRWTLRITPDMAPNAYIHVSYLQPHSQTENDRPLRLYGVLPLNVSDPATRLEPVLDLPPEFKPQSEAVIRVREARGRALTYTLAVVDEGLLRITNFKVPEAWRHFYQKIASRVNGYDLFNYVAGAWSGALESVAAVGGGDALVDDGSKKNNRFPPVVQVLGPLSLAAGQTAEHRLPFGAYQGAVRVMVVAADAGTGAFGSVEREVPVRDDLTLLATLPRVLSVEETVDLPATLFVNKEGLGPVTLRAQVLNDPVTAPAAPGESVQAARLIGPAEVVLPAGGLGERTSFFRLAAGTRRAWITVRLEAQAGAARATQDIRVEVRHPGLPVSQVVTQVVQPGQSWSSSLTWPGLPGTNEATLQLSLLPSVDLGRKLDWLIRYPYGCLEQTTSAAFPQLFLGDLVELSAERRAQLTENVQAAINRLSRFQTASGGLAYWPGAPKPDLWANNYAGHFLVEARSRGFSIPEALWDGWLTYMTEQANRWAKTADTWSLDQAYRLYVLAAAGRPQLGAMNRLRETPGLQDVDRWRLAMAYQLAGQRDLAASLADGARLTVRSYKESVGTYGSGYRDRAMILEALVRLDRLAQAAPVALELVREVNEYAYYSTQTTAYQLLALSQYQARALSNRSEGLSARFTRGGRSVDLAGRKPLIEHTVDPAEGGTEFRLENRQSSPLYATWILKGLAPLGSEVPRSQGFNLSLTYLDDKGRTVDPGRVALGQDLTAVVTVTNTSGLRQDNLALAWLAAGSWELTNPRLWAEAETDTESRNRREEYRPPLYDYQDVRDDRVYTFFSLNPGEQRRFRFGATVAYGGRFYLPQVKVEAMYDPTVYAQTAGRWLDDSSRPLGPAPGSGSVIPPTRGRGPAR